MYTINFHTSATICSPQTYSTHACSNGPCHLSQKHLRRPVRPVPMLKASEWICGLNSSPAVFTSKNEVGTIELPGPYRIHQISKSPNITSQSNNAATWSRNIRVSRQQIRTQAATSPPLNPTEQREEEENDGAPMEVPSEAQYAAHVEDEPSPVAAARSIRAWKPPRYIWRAMAAFLMAGQVIARIARLRIHWRNTLQQLKEVGPGSVGVSLLTACFVGMAFTIQFVREFARLGLTRSVGGVLALAMMRELSPVVTAIIMAGRVGSSFAAELGTMQVSEQTDTLRVLGTDPVDYLVTPRVIACCLALPILTLLCFTVGMAASVLLADAVYNVSSNIILDSAARALQAWDLLSMMVKSIVFGGIIAGVSCAWGTTTMGGAKGVGESTTSAVVISLVIVFIADFALSWCFFQGAGDALKAALG